MSTPALLQTIKSRGYWKVIVRPDVFLADALPKLQLVEETIRACTVQVRGWDYPHWPRDGAPRVGEAIEGVTDWEDHKEYWKAFKSGQFIHFFAMREDWLRENSSFRRIDIAPNAVLSYDSTVFSFTEIFLFAARWASRLPHSSNFTVELLLNGLANRQLSTFDASRVPFDEWHKAHIPYWSASHSFTASELISSPKELAVNQVIQLLEQFSFDATPETIRAVQDALRPMAG